MTYTKLQSQDDGSWHSWLSINCIDCLEYQIASVDDQIVLEFLDWDRAEEFAQEFGL
jgi:hypothetical protein